MQRILQKSVEILTLYRYPYAQKVRRFFSFPRVYKRIMKKSEVVCEKRKSRENEYKNRRKIALEVLKNRYFIGRKVQKIGGLFNDISLSYCRKFTPIFYFNINRIR